MNTTQQVIDQTVCWVKTVIVACNFCPFAKRELDRGSIRYRVVTAIEPEACLQALIDECVFLDSNPGTATTLLIFPAAYAAFDEYLHMLNIAEKLLRQQAYEGVYQLASFHPDYIFADSIAEDAANYTNRSPYPMLHIIREAGLEKALQHYPDPEHIPQRNVDYARSQGRDAMKGLLDRCRKAGIK